MRSETLESAERPRARWVRPRIRDGFVWAWWSVATIVCVTVFEFLSLVGPRALRAERYCRLVRTWGRLLALGHRLDIEGAERIPRDEPVLLVSNHQSSFDIPLLHAVLPVTFRWLARRDLFRIPFLGRAMRRMDAIEVDRVDKRSSSAALRAALDALKAGQNVMVFPEGTWGEADGQMREFKVGAFALAHRSGVRVVPLTIIGSNRVNVPRTPYIHLGAVRVIVHEPLPAAAAQALDAATWLRELRETIGRPLRS